MYSFNYNYRVRYADTDQMGYLYYGNYAKLYEIGRVETIRSLGFSYKEFETRLSIMLPVVSLESRYLKPAFYDDLLTIETKIKDLPSKMIAFECNIFNEKSELINSGLIKLFFVDMITNKRVSAPDEFVQKLISYFD